MKEWQDSDVVVVFKERQPLVEFTVANLSVDPNKSAWQLVELHLPIVD